MRRTFRDIQCQHLIPALNEWAPWHSTRQHARLPPSFLSMDYLRTECSLDSQATWMTNVLDVLNVFDLLFVGVCTIRHWQTSWRLVQELNACTVDLYIRSGSFQLKVTKLTMTHCNVKESRNNCSTKINFERERDIEIS